MNIYSDIILPVGRAASVIIRPPKPDQTVWFPRGDNEIEDTQFVAWRDQNFAGWRTGRIDGIKEWWGATWIHVDADEGADKWLRWDEIPYVQ